MSPMLARFLAWRGVQLQELELVIANSRVMGAAAVNVTSTLAMIAGMSQLVGVYGSNLVTSFGGFRVDYVWAGSLIIQWFLVMASRVREHDVRGFKKDAIDAAWLEFGGVLILAAAIILYIYLISRHGFDGRLWLALMFTANVLNLSGRGALLVRRIIWLRRAST